MGLPNLQGPSEIHSWSLWAKSSKDGASWHALPAHLMDVAATAGELWDRLPKSSKSCAIRAFGSAEAAKKVVQFLAAAHDVGKANPGFQGKVEEHRIRLGLTVWNEPAKHGQATGSYLNQWLSSAWHWPYMTSKLVAAAVAGHHGTFFTCMKGSTLRVNTPPWEQLGETMLRELSLELVGDTPDAPDQDFLNPFLAWLSGFVTVADWLGSHEEMTVWDTTPKALGSYLVEAQRRAQSLLDRLGFQEVRAGVHRPLSSLLPPGAHPNDLQKKCGSLAEASFKVAIIEAPTGEGKTEAAFALCEPRRAEGGGVYFALPTMATANGIYLRVREFLASGQSDEASTRLLHSLAWLYRDSFESVTTIGEEDSVLSTEDWFSGNKRSLLSPHGVGTIDQALIAALSTRHHFVRLFALAGKVVVIDEVHAYDVYMSDLLGTMIGWLVALDCQVILLSATLPKARRYALLESCGVVMDEAKGQADYPCVTVITDGGVVQSVPVDVAPRKPLTFSPLDPDGAPTWLAGAEQVLRLCQKEPGVAALVVNTVSEAQMAYGWLREHAPEVRLDLFHARYTAEDRQWIEERVLERYGKARSNREPAILVATQVVEQSLDLDFDHMVTSLAPIDLLIQRAGRLHRHRRSTFGGVHDGPDSRPNPTLYVVMPDTDSTGRFVLSDPVYEKRLLARTQMAIGEELLIREPIDVFRAVEHVYSEEFREDDLEAWDSSYLEGLEKAARGREKKLHKEADRAMIAEVRDPDIFLTQNHIVLDENDERHGSMFAARTRFEDRPSMKVVVSAPGTMPRSPREIALSCVSITPPWYLLEDLQEMSPVASWKKFGLFRESRHLGAKGNWIYTSRYRIMYEAPQSSGGRGLLWERTENLA